MESSIQRLQPAASLVARLVLGSIMIAHGSQKIFPHGALYNFAHFVSHLGLPYWMGYVAAFTEFFGGVLLVAGFLTIFASFGVLIDMAVAILKVHLHHGLVGNGGFEFPLALLALSFVLIATGPGYLAVDHRVFR